MALKTLNVTIPSDDPENRDNGKRKHIKTTGRWQWRGKFTTCQVTGCGKSIECRGWCNVHYLRWKKHGNPNGGKHYTTNIELVAAVEEAVAYKSLDCLTWPYSRMNKGYGAIGKKLVHRLVCRRVNGPPPTPSHEATHSCGNGHLGCINGSHLSWKTHKDNMAESRRVGRWTRRRAA